MFAIVNNESEVVFMMGYDGYNMMGVGGYGFGLLAFLFWIILFIDAILVGIWLWKQIQK